MPNLHDALNHEIVGSIDEDGQSFALVKHQVGRDAYHYSVHVSFSNWHHTMPERVEFLRWLGFNPCGDPCHYVSGGVNAVSRAAAPDFDIARFAAALGPAHSDVVEAVRVFGDCGFEDKNRTGGGDGHTGPPSREVRGEFEDDHVQYVMTVFSRGSGWVTHYRLKDPNSEIRRVLTWLKLRSFPQCPTFDFEECFWSHLELRTSRGLFDTNAETASKAFKAHENFAEACLRMLNAESQLAPFRMSFLPGASTTDPN